MVATTQLFRAVFAEFGDAGAFPDIAVQYWLTEGYAELDALRFGSSIDTAAMLFAGHNMTLSARAVALAAAGGDVGASAAPIASKGVGPVSLSYDVQASAIEGAGIYNSTSYGQRLYKMMQTFCGGPVYRSTRRAAFPLGYFFPLLPS